MATKKMEIKTKSGFTWEIDPSLADDMELMDEIIMMGKGQGTLSPGEVIAKMIGEDGKEALYKHCTVKGKVSAKKVVPMVDEIYLAAVELLKKA